jgi:transcriptional regulator with PAS, ATPase and Fis domain
LAEAIHSASSRQAYPFITINCANLAPELLESELFGHERGSFTGASTRKIGKFEAAKGGTVFLDEIGEMPTNLQAKLLRVLETKKFERLGGNITIPADVRIITATHQNLSLLTIAGKFRSDLLFRINVLPLTMMALKERPECIKPLANIILKTFKKEHSRPNLTLSGGALDVLQHFSWPGNIRQLKNVVERAVLLSDGDEITRIDLGDEPVFEDAKDPDLIKLIETPEDNTSSLMDKTNKECILNALINSLWVQKDAAKLLGISARALNYKISKYNITHYTWRKNK